MGARDGEQAGGGGQEVLRDVFRGRRPDAHRTAGMNLSWPGAGTDLFVPVSVWTSVGVMVLLALLLFWLYRRKLLVY